MEILASTLLGIPIGILASICSWWVLFHGIRPQINFSPKISKTEDPKSPGSFLYRIKYENQGKRQIVDVSISAWIHLPGLYDRFPSNEVSFAIGFKNEPYRTHINPPSKGGKRGIFCLDLDKFSPYGQLMLPDELLDKRKVKNLTLEGLLKLRKGSKLEISLIGYDSFSGAKRLFSIMYQENDIIEGVFDKQSLQMSKSSLPS